METNESHEPISLDAQRTGKFLKALAKDPFIAVVVADDGVVTVFSKDLESDHLDRIKKVLSDLEAEGE